MKTNNATILDTFGISAEDFYYLCADSAFTPDYMIEMEIKSFNHGGYSADGSLPEHPIDDDQRIELINELNSIFEKFKNSHFRLCRFRAVENRDDDRELNIIDSESICESTEIRDLVFMFNGSDIYKESGNFYGYEIVILDENRQVDGTAGNFIKGYLKAEYEHL